MESTCFYLGPLTLPRSKSGVALTLNYDLVKWPVQTLMSQTMLWHLSDRGPWPSQSQLLAEKRCSIPCRARGLRSRSTTLWGDPGAIVMNCSCRNPCGCLHSFPCASWRVRYDVQSSHNLSGTGNTRINTWGTQQAYLAEHNLELLTALLTEPRGTVHYK